MKIDYLIKLLSGYDLVKANTILNKTKFSDLEDFKYWQHQKIWEIFRYHRKYTTYYNNLCKATINNWKEVPILSKHDFQTGIKNFISQKYKRKTLYKANTSGSSGQPFWFVKDKDCHSLTWCYIRNRYLALGDDDKGLEARFFGSVKNKPLLGIKEGLKDFLLNRKRFDVFDQSLEYFQKITTLFSQKNFKYIYGYTNSIYAYGQFLENYSSKVLKEICPSIQYILVTAEMCTENMRKKMIEIFGVPVYREYGSSETSIIAIENINFEWEIASQRIHVEVVNEDGEILPFGQSGRILVTDFYNYAMPIIRYDIGDQGSIILKTEFPFLYLDSLVGRISDTIYLPSGKSIPGLVFYYILRDIIEKNDIIKRFIIRQKKIDTFIFEYISKIDLDDINKKKIINASEQYLEPKLIYKFCKVDFIPSKPSGKIQHFFSEIN
ncbi:MAG: AMP-binding protein [Candidatus Marinimicrobia bacterium]|nr:AMP-binding protein [Candidatus Neomarinimicrobiota bacterium]|tara:strand:+ start:5330 stop:6640 length:1311 start_codon:yes stop_codon:yes gene_type:complete